MSRFLALVLIAIGVHSQECASTDAQSPIDLYPPFVTENQDIEWMLGYQENALMYSNGYTLKADGDFGGFRFNGSQFWSTDLAFRSPSEHTLRGTRMPLEMQVHFVDQFQNLAILSVFFRNSTSDSVFLNTLGFGNPQLKGAQMGTLFYTPDPVDLEDFIGRPNDFLMYYGSTTTAPCQSNVTWIILTKTYKISDNQLYNYPENLVGNYRDLQPINDRDVYITSNTQESSSTTISDKSTSSDNTVIENLSLGRTFKPINDNFIMDPMERNELFPEVDNVYNNFN